MFDLSAYPAQIPPVGDQEGRRQLIDHLRQWNQEQMLAKNKRLHGVKVPLDTPYVAAQPSGPPPGTPLVPSSDTVLDPDWPGLRFPHRPCPAAFLVPQSSVCLVNPLRPPGPATSQVWTARFDGDTSCEEPNLVVKIYQASQCPAFVDYTLHSVIARVNEWERILQTFKAEAVSYSRMERLQGTVVPHIFGFFRFVLLNGEPVIALVMERIFGDTGRPSAIWKEGTVKEVDQLTRPLFAAYKRISDCGVLSADVKEDNIIWPKNPVGGETVPIFIDFGLVRDISRVSGTVDWLPRLFKVYNRKPASDWAINKQWIRENVVPGCEIAKAYGLSDEDVKILHSFGDVPK